MRDGGAVLERKQMRLERLRRYVMVVAEKRDQLLAGDGGSLLAT
jgi:hypothetical protein